MTDYTADHRVYFLAPEYDLTERIEPDDRDNYADEKDE